MHISEALMITSGALIGWVMSRRVDKATPRRAPSQDYLAGVNFLVKDQPDRAVEAFLRAVKVERDMVETQFALGALFRRRGELERAIRVHQDLLNREALEPSFREQAAYALSQDYQRAGLMDRAEALLLQLKTSTNYRLTALEDLLSLYEMQREWQKAIDTFKEFAAETKVPYPHAQAHYYCELAEEAIAASQLEQAKALLQKAFKLHKNFARAGLIEAKINLLEHKTDTAITALLTLLSTDARLTLEIVPLLKQSFELRYQGSELDAAWERVAHLAGQPTSGATTLKDALAISLLVLGVLNTPALQALVRGYIEREPLLGGLLNAFEVANTPWPLERLSKISAVLKRQALNQARYRCGECGFSSRWFFWQCPGCRRWDAWVNVSPTESTGANG
jgi:lipopolysaccharide assembly protein B